MIKKYRRKEVTFAASVPLTKAKEDVKMELLLLKDRRWVAQSSRRFEKKRKREEKTRGRG